MKVPLYILHAGKGPVLDCKVNVGMLLAIQHAEYMAIESWKLPLHYRDVPPKL